MDSEFIRDLPPETREELFKRAQRNDILKWLIGSALIAFLGWGSSTYFQNRAAHLQEAQFKHERALQQLQFEHKAKIERKEAERTYLSEYLTFALEEDIEKRLRFAHYFKSLVADSDMAPLWNSYYDELLAASAPVLDPQASPELAAAARIGGLGSLATKRSISRIFLGTEPNMSIDQLTKIHLANGWNDVGLHYLVQPDGRIELGRPIDKTPAFAQGFNSGALAIALACENVTFGAPRNVQCVFPTVQIDATVQLLSGLMGEHDLDLDTLLKRSDVRPLPDRFGGMFDVLKDAVSAQSSQ